MNQQGYQSDSVVVPVVQGMRETLYGIRTRYLHAGSGDPVVLVHGAGPGASATGGWANIIPHLSGRFRLYAPDLIGCGYSDKPRTDFSFQLLVNHLAGFIDAMGLRTVSLVGGSLGGFLAMKYTLDHPARVSRAVMIDTGLIAMGMGLNDGGKSAPQPAYDGRRETLQQFLALMVNDPARITPAFVDAHEEVARMEAHREWLAAFGAYRKLLSEDSSQRQVNDIKTRLPQLAVPWCLIWGEADKVAPIDPMGRGLQALFPNVPFHAVPGAGHQVQNDNPAECARIITEFLK